MSGLRPKIPRGIFGGDHEIHTRQTVEASRHDRRQDIKGNLMKTADICLSCRRKKPCGGYCKKIRKAEEAERKTQEHDC